jgi:hypothetical protein
MPVNRVEPAVLLNRIRGALAALCVLYAAGCGDGSRTDGPVVLSPHSGEVEVWRQFRVEYPNPSWRGNPFDLEFTGTFTHTESGRSLTQFGFHAGDDTWKIHFMPDQPGEWTFRTQSSDGDLDRRGGSFTAVPSDLPGLLEADGIGWRLSGEGPFFPILLAAGPYIRAEPIERTRSFADWARDSAGARIIGTTLLSFAGDSPYTFDQEDRMYEDDAEGERFHLPAWDRLGAFYDAVRDRGMGHYIMVYADDASAPDAHGLPEGRRGSISRPEERLFRYLVARFGAYPIVMWDTGIDIGEYRSDAWIDSFVEWFRTNDPWQHPVGSRTGGGSGGVSPAGATYYSDGLRTLPSRAELLERVMSRTVPTAMTDRYRENFDSPFDGGRDKVRQAAWQMLLTHGTAVYFGGDEAAGYLVDSYSTDLEAAPDLAHVARFAESIADPAALTPADELLGAGDNAMLSRIGDDEYIVWLDVDSLTVDLGAAAGASFEAAWFDPRSGVEVVGDRVSGGGEVVLVVPGPNAAGEPEWVLRLRRTGDAG